MVDVPGYCEFEGPGHMRLGLYDRHGFGKNTGAPPAPIPAGALAPTELYFYVDDMAPALKNMAAAGARMLSPPKPRDWGDEAAYFADPDGNVLVLARQGTA